MGWRERKFGHDGGGQRGWRMEVLTEEEVAGEKAGERKWNLMNRGRQGASMRK